MRVLNTYIQLKGVFSMDTRLSYLAKAEKTADMRMAAVPMKKGWMK